MKGQVECTIPQRQFENIRTTYEFTDEKSRDVAYESIIADCIKYKNIVNRKIEELEEQKEVVKVRSAIESDPEGNKINVDYYSNGTKQSTRIL